VDSAINELQEKAMFPGILSSRPICMAYAVLQGLTFSDAMWEGAGYRLLTIVLFPLFIFDGLWSPIVVFVLAVAYASAIHWLLGWAARGDAANAEEAH